MEQFRNVKPKRTSSAIKDRNKSGALSPAIVKSMEKKLFVSNLKVFDLVEGRGPQDNDKNDNNFEGDVSEDGWLEGTCTGKLIALDYQ